MIERQKDNRRSELLSSPKWVRAFLGEQAVADSRHTKRLRGHGQIPVYYFPKDDVKVECLELVGSDEQKAKPECVGHVTFAWQAMDAWYEEDEQIHYHPHAPYHLLDVRANSRHMRVNLRGETIAETKRPVLLLEAGLPAQYHIPQQDVRMGMLRPTGRTTHYGYKGIASYYSAHLNNFQTVKDSAWYYPLVLSLS